MSEYDDLLEGLTEGEEPSNQGGLPKPSPSVNPKRKAPKIVELQAGHDRRGNRRLKERQCSRWMFHRSGEWCKTCGRKW